MPVNSQVDLDRYEAPALKGVRLLMYRFPEAAYNTPASTYFCYPQCAAELRSKVSILLG